MKLYKALGLTFPSGEATIPYGSKIISEERGGAIMEKILAVAIFVVMFALIIWDRFPRQWVTLGSGALVLVLVFGLCMHDGGAIWEKLTLS